MTTSPAQPPQATHRYCSIRLDQTSLRILRELGQNNLSKGIRIAAQLTTEQSKTHLLPHVLDTAIKLAHAEQTTVAEIVTKALTAYEASLSADGKVPEFYRGTYNLKTRNTHRDSKIVHMILEGTPRAIVAAKFNLSLPRIQQILADYRQANKHNPDAMKPWRPKPKSKNQQLMEKAMEELEALNTAPPKPTPEPTTATATPQTTAQGNPLPYSDEDLEDFLD